MVYLEGEGVLNKKLYERPPLLIFAEKSPLKIFRINLETPCIMHLLVRDRHRYPTFRKFFSIQRWITAKVLGIQKKCLYAFFIANLINYIFFLTIFSYQF